MGTQKLLLPFGGTTVLGRVAGSLLAAPLNGVVVVVSAAGDAVAAEAMAAGASTVVNPDPEADMLSSVRCGIRALPGDAEGALVALGDQPTLTASNVKAMLEVFSRRADAVVVPVHGGRRGHPLLFASRWFGDVLTRYDGVGLRGLLAEHAEAILELPVTDEWILRDVDDPQAYERAVRAAAEP
jgi:molybdenum cofactor cytidylyltransferase